MAETSLIRRLAGVPRLFDALRWTLEGGYRGHHHVVQNNLVDAGHVLDLGCGTGIYAHFFPPDRYLGVDISPEYIAAARSKFPRHQFQVHDATAVPLPSQSFDACMVSGVLHHLDDRDADHLLAEAARVVRPDGKIVIWEDIPAPWWNVVGHVIHRLDLGNHIRTPSDYQRVIERRLEVFHASAMRSGAMDYQVFLARPRSPTP